ncbi:MAG: shikimate dehydrogenase, partial [Dethiobacteria bacterium]
MKQIDFAFIVHPLTMDDFLKKFGFMRRLPQFLARAAVSLFPPVVASYVSGISSPYNSTAGCFIGVMLTSEQMLQLPQEVSLRKIIAAGKKAAQAGAKIIGLGAMTAVVGDAGITVAQNLNIAVTTGNSYTVATALEGTYRAAELMGLDIEQAGVAVLG